MKTSALIVTWNNAATVGRCLKSLFASVGGGPFEVLVWDNASTDGTLAAIERTGLPIHVYPSGTNVGFARGMNGLAAAAHGDALLLLNPDAYISPAALAALAGALEAGDDVAIAGGALAFADGRAQPVCARTFPTPFETARWVVTGRRREGPPTPHSRQEVEAVSGAFLLVRRGFWDEARGLDPSFPHGGEDLRICLDAWRNGRRVLFEPAATAVHELEASVKQAPPEIDVLRWEGIVRFAEVSHGRGWGLALRALLALRVGAVVGLANLGILRLPERRRRRASLLLTWALTRAVPSSAQLRVSPGDPA